MSWDYCRHTKRGIITFLTDFQAKNRSEGWPRAKIAQVKSTPALDRLGDSLGMSWDYCRHTKREIIAFLTDFQATKAK
jgi:hypothetical protein